MEVLQTVGPHQPDEMCIPAMGGERPEHVSGVSQPCPMFEIADEHLRVIADQLSNGVEPVIEVRRLGF